MQTWQFIVIGIFWAYATLAFFRAIRQVIEHSNPFGLATPFILTGSFVWGDAVIFGLFWNVVIAFVLIHQDWFLMLLVYSVFWFFRSIGETIYWLNQQFSSINRNPPEKFAHFAIFKGDSAWFINQIIYQCLSVITGITSLYLASSWLQ